LGKRGKEMIEERERTRALRDALNLLRSGGGVNTHNEPERQGSKSKKLSQSEANAYLTKGEKNSVGYFWRREVTGKEDKETLNIKTEGLAG